MTRTSPSVKRCFVKESLRLTPEADKQSAQIISPKKAKSFVSKIKEDVV